MPAVLAHLYVSVACSCDPTFIAYPHGLPIVWYLDWFFRLVWCLVLCFSRSLCADSADGSSSGSCHCLAQCCRGGGFSPYYLVFIAILGFSCYCLRNFHACDYLPGVRLWGSLFAPYAYPTLRPSPAVAGLVGFRCGPHHWLSLRVCVGHFWGGGAVSSFSPPARHGVGYC